MRYFFQLPCYDSREFKFFNEFEEFNSCLEILQPGAPM